MNSFISIDGDAIGKGITQLRLKNDKEGVRTLNRIITAGNEIFSAWTLSSLGEIIEVNGDEGSFIVPSEHIGEVETLREEYFKSTGYTVSVGIGKDLAESSKALFVAKITGKNKIIQYTDKCDELIEQAQAEAENNVQKEVKEYFKSEETFTTLTKNDWAQTFNKIAQTQKDKEQLELEAKTLTLEQIKQRIVSILMLLKNNSKNIAILKQTNPDLYNSFLALVKEVLNNVRT